MGQKLAASIGFDEMKAKPADPVDLASSIKLAMTERRELKSLEYARVANDAARKIAQGGMLPSLAAFGSLGYGKPGLDFINKDWMDYWLLGVGAEWNLWTWGKTRSQVQQAQLKINSLDEIERQARDGITLDVTQACLLMEEATKRFQLTATMEAQCLESFRMTENSYKQGQATHTEFFDAQSELTRARLQKAQAEIDQALAQANWRRAVGVNIKEYE